MQNRTVSCPYFFPFLTETLMLMAIIYHYSLEVLVKLDLKHPQLAANSYDQCKVSWGLMFKTLCGCREGVSRYLWPTPGMLAASPSHCDPGSPQAGSSPAPPQERAPYFYSGFFPALVWAATAAGTRRGYQTGGSQWRSQ